MKRVAYFLNQLRQRCFVLAARGTDHLRAGIGQFTEKPEVGLRAKVIGHIDDRGERSDGIIAALVMNQHRFGDFLFDLPKIQERDADCGMIEAISPGFLLYDHLGRLLGFFDDLFKSARVAVEKDHLAHVM